MFKKFSHIQITYSQLLLYGVHVGHSFSNSILYSSWLVYTYMGNLLIINLYNQFFYEEVALKVFHMLYVYVVLLIY